MAAYCTQSDVEICIGGEKNLREISDHDREGHIDVAVVARAIESAQGTIDEALVKQYAVPISPVPTGLRDRCAELAVFNLKRWNNKGALTPQDVEWKKQFFEELLHFASFTIAPNVDPQPTKADARVDGWREGDDNARGLGTWRSKFKGYT